MAKELRNSLRFFTQILVNNLTYDLEKRKFHKRKKRAWVRKWISRRQTLGASEKLLTELSLEDANGYRNHLRLTNEKFNCLLQLVTPELQKKNTQMRDALPVELKLQVTLRYLAAGDSFASLEYLYRVPKCTISKFLPQVCAAIYSALKDYLEVSNKAYTIIINESHYIIYCQPQNYEFETKTSI